MPLWQITGLSPAFLRVNKVLHIRLIQDRQSLVSGRSLIIFEMIFYHIRDWFIQLHLLYQVNIQRLFALNILITWRAFTTFCFKLPDPFPFTLLLKEYGSYLSYSVLMHCALAAVFQQLFRLVLDFFQSHGLYCTSCSIHIPICYLFHLKRRFFLFGFFCVL